MGLVTVSAYSRDVRICVSPNPGTSGSTGPRSQKCTFKDSKSTVPERLTGVDERGQMIGEPTSDRVESTSDRECARLIGEGRRQLATRTHAIR